LLFFVAISDLVLIGIHVRPNDAVVEINGLVAVYEAAERRYNTTHIIIMGDLNADCSYLSNTRYNSLAFTTDSRFLWLISKEDDTTTSNSSCAYDRYTKADCFVLLYIVHTYVQCLTYMHAHTHTHALTLC